MPVCGIHYCSMVLRCGAVCRERHEADAEQREDQAEADEHRSPAELPHHRRMYLSRRGCFLVGALFIRSFPSSRARRGVTCCLGVDFVPLCSFPPPPVDRYFPALRLRHLHDCVWHLGEPNWCEFSSHPTLGCLCGKDRQQR